MDDRHPMKLLVVASDPMEFRGILAHASEVRRTSLESDWARTIRLGANELLLVANGAGVRRAAAAAEPAVKAFEPDAIASIGFCGALAPELAVADILVATEVLDGEARYITARVESARPHHRGVVYTGSRVVQSAAERRSLRITGAAVVEMEASAAAECARIHNLPFYCIKVVTDLAGETMLNDFNRALREDGHFDTIVLLKGTFRQPIARIAELLRLRGRCVLSTRAMGDFIADCRF
jgi:adenosylhomocysteine nucleosidase